MPNTSMSTDPPDFSELHTEKPPDQDSGMQTFDLAALSAASDGYVAPSGGHARPRPSIVIGLLVSLMVGAALTMAGRFQFRGGAKIQITGDTSPEKNELYRTELLVFAWDRQAAEVSSKSAQDRWTVEMNPGNHLRLSLVSGSRSSAAQRVADVAESFCSAKNAEALTARETPGEAETVLAEYITDLEAKIGATQRELDTLLDLPGEDPFREHKVLRGQWDQMRRDFNQVRERLALATREREEEALRARADVALGLVRAEDRNRMIETDQALQQDLRELVVNLAEIKQYANGVWKKSVAPLDQLRVAAESLVDVAAPSIKRAASAATKKQAEQLIAASQRYRDEIAAFTERWDQQFSALEKLDVDPLTDTILTELDRTKSLLNGFLFDAGEQLASLRTQVRAIGEDPSEDARHHVFLSNLTRAFQTVPSVHHRFAFASRKIEGTNNFRLDTSLTSAQGLRHRTRDRIAAIEEALRADATEREERERVDRVAAAEELVRDLRAETDRAIDTMLSIQKELNLTADRGEAFSHAVLKMEVTAGRLKMFQADMQRNQHRIRDLAADRVAMANSVSFRFASREPVTGPENLRERLGFGGLAAALTFATALFMQWWIIRRSSSDLPQREASPRRFLPRLGRKRSARKSAPSIPHQSPIRMD